MRALIGEAVWPQDCTKTLAIKGFGAPGTPNPAEAGLMVRLRAIFVVPSKGVIVGGFVSAFSCRETITNKKILAG